MYIKTYDPWGKLLSVESDFGQYDRDISLLNPFRYRGYYYDDETGSYYLQSRYYDPEVGRFINCDDVNYIGITESELSYNAFAYCVNEPENCIDPSGTTSYMFVYDRTGKDFIKQANWMKNKYFKNEEVVFFYIHQWKDFCKRWNSLKNKRVDDIFLFLHGGVGNLHFKDEQILIKSINKDLKTINKITRKIYLLSCQGGTADEKGESVAKALAKKQKDTRVRAVVGGYVYYRSWYQLFSYKPLTKQKNAYWADFVYCKYRGKLTMHIMSIGRNWYYG